MVLLPQGKGKAMSVAPSPPVAPLRGQLLGVALEILKSDLSQEWKDMPFEILKEQLTDFLLTRVTRT